MITQEQQDWIIKAIEMGYTSLQIKKKLQFNDYPDEKILEMLKFYDENKKGYEIEEIPTKKEEKQFENNVKKFLDGNTKDLSWNEKKMIKRFIKNVTKCSQTMKISLDGIKSEIKYISENFTESDKYEKEMEFLRKDICDRIIDLKSILEIEHPKTGEEINSENIKSLTIDELIKLQEENIAELQKVVNGKIN